MRYLPACDGKDRTVVFRLRKVAATSLWALLTLLASGSFGLQSEANDPPHFPFAFVQEGCGPADGSALVFYFTGKPAKCGKYEEPFLMIQIIANLPQSAPRAYTMGSGGSGSRDMLASRCQSPGHCEAATSGFLHLTKFSQGKNATGEYELHFRDGSIEKGNFAATRCIVNLICR